ncbi:hypothetical protein HDU98_009725 [Podochytrium sp. JEL0797]|nr:hypothetical protein HDU98_009725 [Podochytrium sp. JEL0797]
MQSHDSPATSPSLTRRYAGKTPGKGRHMAASHEEEEPVEDEFSDDNSDSENDDAPANYAPGRGKGKGIGKGIRPGRGKGKGKGYSQQQQVEYDDEFDDEDAEEDEDNEDYEEEEEDYDSLVQRSRSRNDDNNDVEDSEDEEFEEDENEQLQQSRPFGQKHPRYEASDNFELEDDSDDEEDFDSREALSLSGNPLDATAGAASNIPNQSDLFSGTDDFAAFAAEFTSTDPNDMASYFQQTHDTDAFDPSSLPTSAGGPGSASDFSAFASGMGRSESTASLLDLTNDAFVDLDAELELEEQLQPMKKKQRV